MKIYKVITFLLLIACLILGGLLLKENTRIYGVQSLLSTELSLEEVVADYNSLSNLLDLDEALDTTFKLKVSPHAGEPIEAPIAKAKKRDFYDWNDDLFGIRLSPYAFAFGSERLKKMLKDIEDANTVMNTSDDRELIKGVRIYLVRSQKSRPKKHLDLMIVPVRGNGKDYWPSQPVNYLSDTSHLYLNTSAPCPNNCDQ